MGRLRLVHSFSSRPMRIDCYGRSSLLRLFGNIWYFSLSVAYAKRCGAEIVLHTDTLGKALLSHLPYDEIHLTLDELPADLHPRFWAAGKMWALDAEPLGAIHIDGDVFLKRESLAEDIINSSWDFIAQSYEDGDWYEKDCLPFDRQPHVCVKHGLQIHDLGAYNTGVLGFRDKELRAEYISSYKEMALELSRLEAELLYSNNDLTPDIIIEQRFVYQLCKTRNAKVKLILPLASDLSGQAAGIGYQHVFTNGKFDCLDKCRDTLLKVNPHIYNNTYRLCKDVFMN